MFLALVALAATMVERLPEIAAKEPMLVRHDDELVLLFGKVPERLERAPVRDREILLETTSRDEAAASDDWYVIQSGDTLSSIALEYLGSVGRADDLARLNSLEDPDDLRPGDRIRLR